MNLILFEQTEVSSIKTDIILKPNDPRSLHLKKILKASEGTEVDAGIINGPRGKAFVNSIVHGEYKLSFTPSESPEGLYPLTLILGLSRPPTVKKVLKEATALGVQKFILCGTENGEQSYRQSSALRPEKIREVLIEGAQQAYCTMLPGVNIEHSLRCAIESISTESENILLIGLDNDEPEMSLTEYLQQSGSQQNGADSKRQIILAVGSERGWTVKEKKRLRDSGFTLVSLGKRVLRTETASIAGTALCLSGLGLI